MTFPERIPAERLLGFDLQKGDTLEMVAVVNSEFVAQVNRAEQPAAARGKAAEWLESARGTVILAPGETLERIWRAGRPGFSDGLRISRGNMRVRTIRDHSRSFEFSRRRIL